MKFNKKYLIGLAASALAFVLALTMLVVSVVRSLQETDLGIDISGYEITKMYTDNETIRVIGTQQGEVFAIDLEGKILWNVGKPYDSAVYEIAVNSGDVYAVFANGKAIGFRSEDAVAHGADDFLSRCAVYDAGTSFNTNGNVKNTQLLVPDKGDTFYLRGVFNDVKQTNRIYKFRKGESAGEMLVGTLNAVGGMALGEDGTLFYSARSTVYAYGGGKVSILQDLNETVSAVSYADGTVYAVTGQNNLFAFANSEKAETAKYPLGVSLASDYVFSTGENFVAKIQNGGVAMIDSRAHKVTLSMNASDNANLVMWSDDSFVLRNGANVNAPYITFYSAAQARDMALYSVLVYVFVAVLVVSLLAGAYFGFGMNAHWRAKINGKFVGFFRALKKDKFIYLALVVPFALLILFYYIPIVLGFGLSFFDYIPGVKLVFLGFDNFVSVVMNMQFWNSAVTMLVFLIADLIKAIIPPLILAEAILAVKFKRFSMVVRVLLFLPGVLPGVATTLVWSSGVFGSNANSLVNAFIDIFVPGFVKNWVYSASNATAIGTLIAFGFPWIGSYLIFFGAISGINASVFEAAKLDGCGWGRRIMEMDIPLIMPQIKYIIVTSFIASVQNYTNIFILHGINGQVQTPALLMYREILNANYGVASVMGLFIFAFLSVGTVLNFKMQTQKD